MVESLKESQFDGHIHYHFHYVAVMEMGAQLCLACGYQLRSSRENAISASMNER